MVYVKPADLKNINQLMRKLKSDGKKLETIKLTDEYYKKYLDSECDLSSDSLLISCDFDWSVAQSEDKEEI